MSSKHQTQQSWSPSLAGFQAFLTLLSFLLTATLASQMSLDCPILVARFMSLLISTDQSPYKLLQVIVKFRFINILFQVVYILDQVRALEEELLLRIKQQGLSFKPHILVVSYKNDG